MKALKIIVIVMGVMLVAGVAALAVAVAERLGHPAAPLPASSAAPRIVGIPAGAHVISAETQGDRVTVRLALADGAEQLWLIDWRSGARLATIELRPARTP
jgi:hypothetical protein